MVNRKFGGLTLRQAQALTSIGYRKSNFGAVHLSNLIEDMGVAFATLADHLEALQKEGYITTPENKNPHNLDFNDEIGLTRRGEATARTVVSHIKASYRDTVGSMFQSLRREYEPSTQLALFGDTLTASFAKAFEKLVRQDPTEPVLTTIAMYTDLDGQLSMLQQKNHQKYLELSQVKLNLEIRNGRLASIAIPTTIRRQTRLTDLRQILKTSWSWMGAVSSMSNRRYWQEARSLGLLQVDGDLLHSTKPSTVDTISWLAMKTNFTFINTFHTAPKSSLVVFRESFRMPLVDDLFEPSKAQYPLTWLEPIKEGMQDKSDYTSAVQGALRILKDETGLLTEYDGRIVPSTVIRKTGEVPDLKESFQTILKNPDTLTYSILVAVTAKPAVSMIDLIQELNRKTSRKFKAEEIEDMIGILANRSLIHIATSSAPMGDSTKLFSFIHLPFLSSKAGANRDTNAVLRSMKPYYLQQVSELFDSDSERQAIAEVFTDLMDAKEVEFENVESQFGKPVGRKLVKLATTLEPFVRMSKDFSRFTVNRDSEGLSKVIIDSLTYSALTGNQALALYNNAISNMIDKDQSWREGLEAEAEGIRNELIEKNMKTPF